MWTELPKHTFYVDNIFRVPATSHVKNMYYLDVNFYRYFIGRSDQSVNEQVMIGRIDHAAAGDKADVRYYDVTKIPNRKAEALYDFLSGNHDDHLLCACDQVRNRGKYGKRRRKYGSF